MSVRRACPLFAPLLVAAVLLTSGARSRAAPSAPTASARNVYDDVAVGVPGESIGSASGAGAVHVMLDPGSDSPNLGHLFLVQGDGLVEDVAQDGDGFGTVLAGGDFNFDGYEDLAVSAPGEGLAPGGALGTLGEPTVTASQLAAHAASTAPIVGPDIAIYEGEGLHRTPDVAYNWRRDEYLVVWQTDCGGAKTSIYARRISGTGEILSWFPVAAGPKNFVAPSVAYDGDRDRYLVAWTIDRVEGSSSVRDVYGRFIPWNGVDPDMKDFPISALPSRQSSPKVVYNENPDWPEFLVAWHVAPTAGPWTIRGRRVYADGTGFPPGDDFPISDHAPTDVYSDFDVAYNLARNEYLVAYDNGVDIYAARLEANGNILGGGEIPIATWPNPEPQPTVAACHTANQYFVTWQSLHPDYADTYGRFVNGDGTVADVLHVNTSSRGEAPAVIACNPNAREYLVVWEEAVTFGARSIWGRLLHTDKTQGAPFVIVPPSGDYGPSNPAIAAGTVNYLVVWTDAYLSSGTLHVDIHGRLVSPNGVYLPLVIRIGTGR